MSLPGSPWQAWGGVQGRKATSAEKSQRAQGEVQGRREPSVAETQNQGKQSGLHQISQDVPHTLSRTTQTVKQPLAILLRMDSSSCNESPGCVLTVARTLLRSEESSPK